METGTSNELQKLLEESVSVNSLPEAERIAFIEKIAGLGEQAKARVVEVLKKEKEDLDIVKKIETNKTKLETLTKKFEKEVREYREKKDTKEEKAEINKLISNL